MIVFDTDILSTFAKVDKLNLLFKLFEGNRIVYTISVKADLKKAKNKGYSFVDNIFNERFEVIQLSKKELNYATQFQSGNLGLGELQSLALAKLRGGVFITNDIAAQKAAEGLGIDYLTLSDILHAFIKENILPKRTVKELIAEIEHKDNVKIMDKDSILRYR